VPRVGLECCRVGDDGDVTAAQPSRAVLRRLPGLAARAGRQVVCLHGAGTRSPTRRDECVCVSGSRHVEWPMPQSETETPRANERLVVRDRDLSGEVETARRESL
jgi:hypothetical protein